MSTKTEAETAKIEEGVQACTGARVMYCGHNGWFVADIWRVRDAVVVRGPAKGVSPGTIVRGQNREGTHRLVDFPSAGFWRPDLGLFVVPADQVTLLKPEGD